MLDISRLILMLADCSANLQKKWSTRTIYQNLSVVNLQMQIYKILDPVGSTVRYEMMKLCDGSV